MMKNKRKAVKPAKPVAAPAPKLKFVPGDIVIVEHGPDKYVVASVEYATVTDGVPAYSLNGWTGNYEEARLKAYTE